MRQRKERTGYQSRDRPGQPGPSKPGTEVLQQEPAEEVLLTRGLQRRGQHHDDQQPEPLRGAIRRWRVEQHAQGEVDHPQRREDQGAAHQPAPAHPADDRGDVARPDPVHHPDRQTGGGDQRGQGEVERQEPDRARVVALKHSSDVATQVRYVQDQRTQRGHQRGHEYRQRFDESCDQEQCDDRLPPAGPPTAEQLVIAPGNRRHRIRRTRRGWRRPPDRIGPARDRGPVRSASGRLDRTPSGNRRQQPAGAGPHRRGEPGSRSVVEAPVGAPSDRWARGCSTAWPTVEDASPSWVPSE